MFEKELDAMINAALAAQEKILEIYDTAFEIEIKSDNSPVTLADKTADKMIKEALQKEFPTYSFLTEESEDDKTRLNNDYVFIIDPVDGTKDFVARDGEFTTNIALAYKHEIVVGVITIPVKKELYYATKGKGSFYRVGGVNKKIHVNNKISDLTVLTSRFHSQDNETAMIKKHSDKIKHIECAGSSLKGCYIAHGKAEISYRLSNGTKEWDTAAFDIIVSEAGGVVLKPNGEKMKYNREDVYNRDGYIIANRKENILL
jgi:3'(2'), 5'-bisphosphate nucleotidase